MGCLETIYHRQFVVNPISKAHVWEQRVGTTIQQTSINVQTSDSFDVGSEGILRNE